MNWVYDGLSEEQRDVVVLLREISLFLNTRELPAGDTVLQFVFTDQEDIAKQYILLHGDKRQVCDENPGYEVDVYLRGTLRAFSEIWWGEVDVRTAIASGSLKVTGSPVYTKRIAKWFPVSSFAGEEKHRLKARRPPQKTA
jgi:putative sterol carrier protein